MKHIISLLFIISFSISSNIVQAKICDGIKGHFDEEWSDLNLQEMKNCLDSGINPNIILPRRQSSILYWATHLWKPDEKDVILFLLERGADPNVTFRGQNILYNVLWSSQDAQGAVEIVKALVEKGVKLDGYSGRYDPFRVKNNHAREAIAYLNNTKSGCADWGETSMLLRASSSDVAKCVASGININEFNTSGKTVLYRALEAGAGREAINSLITNDADLYLPSKTEERITPFNWAMRNSNNPKVLSLILDKGDNALRFRDQKYGGNALHWAAANKNKDAFATVISRYEQLNTRNKNGYTAVHIASHNQNLDNLRMLLKSGADASARDNRGREAIHFAAGFMGVNAIEELRENGADLNAVDNNQATVLHYATWNKAGSEVIKHLIDKSLDLETRDSNGNTVLHAAAQGAQSTAIIDLLLSLGANGAAQNSNGKFPVDEASQNKNLKDTDTYWKLNDAKYQ